MNASGAGPEPEAPEREARRRRLVETSIEVLKAGQAPSGAFVASPTFEQYAYCWLRDGAFCAAALDVADEREASRRFHQWVAGIVLGAADDIERSIAQAHDAGVPDGPAQLEGGYLECRYQLDGTPARDRWPTFQLDGPGIWLWALARHVQPGDPLDPRLDAAARLVSRYLAAFWQLPCWDAWEEFGDRVHTSTLAAIRTGLTAAQRAIAAVASDEAVGTAVEAIARHPVFDGPRLTKWDGSDEVDASLLWSVWPYRLLEATDPRFSSSLAAIERELVTPSLGVHRYPRDSYYGGGAWPVLTAALGGVYLRRGEAGDSERARAALCWIEDQADADGRLPEQVDEHMLAPGRRQHWIELWGPPAHPLLWSHAAYLELHAELVRSTG